MSWQLSETSAFYRKENAQSIFPRYSAWTRVSPWPKLSGGRTKIFLKIVPFLCINGRCRLWRYFKSSGGMQKMCQNDKFSIIPCPSQSHFWIILDFYGPRETQKWHLSAFTGLSRSIKIKKLGCIKNLVDAIVDGMKVWTNLRGREIDLVEVVAILDHFQEIVLEN